MTSGRWEGERGRRRARISLDSAALPGTARQEIQNDKRRSRCAGKKPVRFAGFARETIPRDFRNQPAGSCFRGGGIGLRVNCSE